MDEAPGPGWPAETCLPLCGTEDCSCQGQVVALLGCGDPSPRQGVILGGVLKS